MVKLELEIGLGTIERLSRKFREETGIYCIPSVQADEFDQWFDRWLNHILVAKSWEEEIGEMERDCGED